MNYALKLWCGRDAAEFLEQWAPGGVFIRADVLGAYYTARGKGSLVNLTEQAALWELRDAPLGLREFLQIGFAAEWTWERIDWDVPARPHPDELESEARLRRLIAGGAPDAANKEAVLRLAYRLTARWGPVHRISGRIRENPAIVYAPGIVVYDRTPHPQAFLARVADALFGPLPQEAT